MIRICKVFAAVFRPLSNDLSKIIFLRLGSKNVFFNMKEKLFFANFLIKVRTVPTVQSREIVMLRRIRQIQYTKPFHKRIFFFQVKVVLASRHLLTRCS